MMNRVTRIRIFNKIPWIGITLFALLYVYSSTLYPGGSQADLNSESFDWMHNYWCHLMNERGMNGKPNPARPFSIGAILILCFSLIVFFVQFAEVYSTSLVWKRTIQVGGALSMVFASLMFTQYHDLMSLVSSFFGFFAIIGIIKEIYRSDLLIYQVSGLCGLILLALNNCIYYSGQGIEYLPFIQKITFLVVLLWVIGVNAELSKNMKR